MILFFTGRLLCPKSLGRVKLQTLIPDQSNYGETFKSEHCLFDEWDKTDPRYLDASEFTRATFLIQVAGLVRTRSLTIYPPDVTIYDRGTGDR